MTTALSFDDILIVPKYSDISSRKDVNPTINFLGEKIFPVISANMDTVTEANMATAMGKHGARGCLHRFQSIEDNVKMFAESRLINGQSTYVSVGVGKTELDRFKALVDNGATHVILDVAHGASKSVVEQVRKIRQIDSNIYLIVGNFATSSEITDFQFKVGQMHVDAYKVGIGGGSLCTTRIVTGCGYPTFASTVDCANIGIPIIADGGIRNSADICKALAAGASVVMLGSMLAGTDESPGEVITEWKPGHKAAQYKKYRGSASQESYDSQGKNASHRTAEGESSIVPYKGPLKPILEQIEGGLRSSMSYVGASNLLDFREEAEFVRITSAGMIESKAHGKLNY